MCFPALVLPACQNAWYKACSNFQKERLLCRQSAGKIRMRKMKPSCEQSLCPELFAIPAGIRGYYS